MKTERKQVKLDSIINHISHKCGLSRSMSRRVLQELVDFICLNLYGSSDNVVFLPRLGFFYSDKTNTKVSVKYEASSYINNLLNSCSEFNKGTEEELVYIEPVKNLNGLSSSEVEFVPGANGFKKVDNPKNAPDIVRSSFIDYLQEEFIYGESWEHPITKTKYEKEEIQKALSVYKEYAPQLYNALRFLWISQYNRATIAKHFHVSSSSIRRSWNKAIDGVILIMLYPELEPGVCIKLYNSRR